MSEENLDFTSIKLEETGLFNYRGRQSSVYNRLLDNNIETLKDLFVLDEANQINLGVDKLGNNYYIHDEVKGIIRLLKYKYLKIFSDELIELLNFKINTADLFFNSFAHNTGYPGRIFDTVLDNEFATPKRFKDPKINSFVNDFYKTLKSCGFDQTSTKVLIDMVFEKKLDSVSLGDFLFNLNLDEIKKYFSKVPQEYSPFLNIYKIIIEHYEKYYTKENSRKK